MKPLDARPNPTGLPGLVFLALALLLAGQVWAAPRAVPAGGTAVVALPTELEGLDPGRAMSRSTWRVLSCVFETLVRPGERAGEVVPALAATWESGEGGREWLIHLRRDVYFHDGQRLTAHAVVLSLRRQFDPQITPSVSQRAQYAFWRGLLGGSPGVVKSVSAVDSDTVRIVLREPVRDFLEILAHPPLAIVSPAMARGGDGAAPVGTGPFRFVEWRSGQRLTLESNLHYWGGRPPLDYVIFTCVPRASARSRELLRGNADFSVALDLLEVDSLKESSSGTLEVWTGSGLNSWSLAMNCSRRPWSDIRTRVALQGSLPRSDLARRFARSRGLAAAGFLSPKCWAYDPTLKAPGYQPERAKRLLSRVRAPKSVDLLYPLESPVVADTQGLALQIAGRLAAAGLSATPRAIDGAELVRRLQRGSYDLALLLEERGVVDPDLALYPAWSRENLQGGGNYSRFSSGRLQDLLVMGRTVADRTHRRQVYSEVQEQLQEASPAVPLAWSLEVLARRRSLNGVTVDRLGMLDFSRAWLGHR